MRPLVLQLACRRIIAIPEGDYSTSRVEVAVLERSLCQWNVGWRR